ncbi:MAG: hypothetical protein JO316_16640 [Abitibacteriaceae bacterium]|nr:hypothetical protein [Abditibacteriaceae bacterium]MBV9866982.1 hypothetical protein [Abditibacteriaceae bacterium]
MLPRNVLYYGREEPLPEPIELCAGPLTLLYDQGDLRYIKLGNCEVLRRVYVAVRDRNWGTVPAVLADVKIEKNQESFHVTYDATHQQGEIDFCWRGSITGDERGHIAFVMDGVARSTFLRNRIGFCVLHPPKECAGQPCKVEKADGTIETGTFPQFIAPQAPFLDMRSIAHEVQPGLWAQVHFSGDVFEMEDQRNWTDASYKTFCTPLRLPYPVEIKAGTKVSQSVRLEFKQNADGETNSSPLTRGRLGGGLSLETPAPITLSIDSTSVTSLPRIGLGTATHGQPLTQQEIARLQVLNLSHLRVDLTLSDAQWQTTLRQTAQEAESLEIGLEVALFLSDAATAELAALRVALEEVKPNVQRWLIFHVAEKSTSAQWVELAREQLSSYDPSAQIGAGTNAYFTELNRGRPPLEVLDCVAYSINPQVHAFDNASLVETTEVVPDTVASARQFCGELPIIISPITLKPRFNPDATGSALALAPDELPAPVDARQVSLFGAGWTLASLNSLAQSGVASMTYYETTGWCGVMETEQGSPLLPVFQSLPGTVYPLYHVLADVGEFAQGQVLRTTSSAALQVQGIALTKHGKIRVLAANLTHKLQEVVVKDLSATVWVRCLDETNAEAAMETPEAFRMAPKAERQTEAEQLTLHLLPYAVACIDMEDK